MKKKIIALTVAIALGMNGTVYASDYVSGQTLKPLLAYSNVDESRVPVLKSGVATRDGEKVKDVKDLDGDGDTKEEITKIVLDNKTATGVLILEEKVANSIDIEQELTFELPEGVKVVGINVRSNQIMYDDASITKDQEDYDVKGGEYDIITAPLFSRFIEFDDNKVTLKNGSLKSRFDLQDEDGNVTGSTGQDVKDSDLITMKIIFYVNIDYDYSGDIDVVVSGDAIAKPLDAVKVASAEQKLGLKTTVTDVYPGYTNSDVGDIIISEINKSTFVNDEVFTLSLEGDNIPYDNLLFAQIPTVTTGTDKLRVKRIDTDRDLKEIYITVEGKTRDKTELATLTISDMQVYTTATVPYTSEPVKLKITSTNSLSSGVELDYINIVKETGVKDFNGFNKDVRFTVGSNIVVTDGEYTVIDGTPYVSKNTGSSMIPLRALSEALGLSDTDIVWYQPTQTATIMINDKVAQFTVGSDVCKINGIDVPMWNASGQTDVVEVVDGRIYLPVRFLGEKVFGVNVGWDASKPNEFIFN